MKRNSINLLDGPAEGVRLTTQQTPAMYLRVCQFDGGRRWEAIDLTSDVPDKSLVVFVYRRSSRVIRTNEFLYRYVPLKPNDRLLSDGDAWSAWCRDQREPE
jgi:hypothetical protein